MLPQLLKNRAVTVIAAKLRPEGSAESSEAESSPADEGLKAAAQDLIDAIHSKDGDGVVSALKAAFEFLDQDEAPAEESSAEEG